MRISDWSSDVCSSDLDRRGRHRRAGTSAAPAVRRAAAPVVAAVAQGRRHGGHTASGFRRVPPSRADRENRSEEHTSELQSLMRISYAVFCLKKQTSHQYIQSKKRISMIITLAN